MGLGKCKFKKWDMPTGVAQIHKADISKCWWGCGAARTHIFYWCEGRMAQPLWKTAWPIITKPNMLFPCNLESHSWVSTHRRWKVCPHKNPNKEVYGSFIHTGQNLEQLRCPSVGECIVNSGPSRQRYIISAKKKLLSIHGKTCRKYILLCI